METIEILDVTVIEPKFKHPVIFNRFDALAQGEAFIINNDHDPKPLYYQLLAERGQTFSWEYLESGPQIWRVKIAKSVSQGETIGDIVAKDFRKAQVFKKLGIDFCCGGKKTLEEVSRKNGLDVNVLKQELAAVEGQNENASFDFNSWDLAFLSDYIANVHHAYVRENIPFISELAAKVARVHGASNPETISVAEGFARVAQDLQLHLMKEENILFPFIKQLEQAKAEGKGIELPAFGSVNNPVHIMESEHEQAGEDMSFIRKLTSDYTLPAHACSSYTILYKKLQEFENDLFNHIHLENNILFPKAVELEKELRAN